MYVYTHTYIHVYVCKYVCTYISNLFPPKLLRMTQNGQFCTTWKFYNLFPLKWLRMTRNGQFYLICNFSNLFPPKWLRMTRNGQFHPIHNFSHILPQKHLIFGEISKFFVPGSGGTLANFLSFSNSFTPKQLKMTHNGEFYQKHGLDSLKMANFGHFAGFSIFSPKMRLRLTQNGQFHSIHNFFHLLPPKHLIFGEISKFFIPGGGYIGKFFEFFKCFELFHTKAAQNDTQW